MPVMPVRPSMVKMVPRFTEKGDLYTKRVKLFDSLNRATMRDDGGFSKHIKRPDSVNIELETSYKVGDDSNVITTITRRMKNGAKVFAESMIGINQGLDGYRTITRNHSSITSTIMQVKNGTGWKTIAKSTCPSNATLNNI